jgi:hypothetical protein
MCRQHNERATHGVLRGPAHIVLARDSKRLLHASSAELRGAVLTATTPYGLRTWSMRDVLEIKWRDPKAKS